MKILYLLAAIALGTGCSQAPKTQVTKPEEPAAVPASPAGQPTNASADDRPLIVAFGDSLSAGFGADPGKSYPDHLQAELDGLKLRYHVVNAGVSGDTTTDGLVRLSTVIALKPAITIVEFGGNDGLRGLPVDTTKTNLEQIIVGLQKAGSKVLLAGMTLPPNYGPQYIHSFENVFRDLAAQYKVPLIPFLLDGVGGHRNLMQRDGIHPTAEGNQIVARTVIKTLRSLL